LPAQNPTGGQINNGTPLNVSPPRLKSCQADLENRKQKDTGIGKAGDSFENPQLVASVRVHTFESSYILTSKLVSLARQCMEKFYVEPVVGDLEDNTPSQGPVRWLIINGSSLWQRVTVCQPSIAIVCHPWVRILPP
jgi:hypothetical protein